MTPPYPPDVGAHVKELRKDFHLALSDTKKVRDNHPVAARTAGAIRDGVRLAIEKGLLGNKWPKPPSKQVQKDFEHLVIAEITSKLQGRTNESMLFDAVPRETLKSLGNSFMELARKIIDAAASFKPDKDSLSADRFTMPASPETVVKAKHRSSSPRNDWQHEQYNPTTEIVETKTPDITFVVTLTKKDAIAGIPDEDLTSLINQSIDSDPEIPNYLTNDNWIDHAHLLNNGDIEIHVETENDRSFLELNTYWRPKLEETLTAQSKAPALPFNKDEIAHLYSVLCSYPVGTEQSKVLFQDTYEPGRKPDPRSH